MINTDMKKLVLLSSLIIPFLFAACDMSPSFDEYNGTSFLASDSLSSEDWALMPDYSFETGTSATDYMDFSATGETGPEGGPVYRLEIKNLLENGDFSDNATAPWLYYDKETLAAPTTTIPTTTQMDITSYDGNYKADFTLENDNATIAERLLLRPSAALTNPLTYIAGKKYNFQFNYLLDSPSREGSYDLYFFSDWDYSSSSNDLDEGSSYQTQQDQAYFPTLDIPVSDPDDPQNVTLNQFTASSTGSDNDYLGFASLQSQYGTFDDFRITRTSEGDFDLRLRLKLTIDHKDTMQMITGYYRFSVWVKAEDVSSLANTYQADRVELGIRGYDELNQSNVDDVKVYYQTQNLADEFATSTGTYTGDWSSAWVLLVFASEYYIQLPSNSDETVFEISISPSNPGSADSSWNRLSPGSILIADPVLEYSETAWE